MSIELDEYVIHWWAWPDGARIASRGIVTEYGRDEQDAIARLRRQFPAIDRIEHVEKIVEPQP